MDDRVRMSALSVLALTLVLTPIVRAGLRRLDVLDHPTTRSSHVRPTVRGGGLGPALAVVAVGGMVLRDAAGAPGFAAWTGVLVCAAGFALLGLTEDVFGIPVVLRFGCQVLLATAGALWLLAGSSGRILFPWLVAIAVVWIVSYVNCCNFMDGINGITAVSVVVAGLAWHAVGRTEGIAVLSTGGALLAAAGLGFLPYNFPRPLVFPGDVGSYFFGAALATLAVCGVLAGAPVEAVLAPLVLPLADTGSTLLRRVARGEAWHRPHRDHAYQRLVALGWSHTRTTATFGLLLAGCALLGMVATRPGLPARAFADVVLGALVLIYLSAPRVLVGRRLANGLPGVPAFSPAAAPADAYASVREDLRREVTP